MPRFCPRSACAGFVAVAACVVALADTAPPYRSAGPLLEPALFGEGVVSTGEYESHPAFTPEGRTLYFVRSTPEFTNWTIYVAEYVDGRWSAPKVAPFSGKHRDADPFITADGKQLYFISDRSTASR
jgi:WD40-like Beta Propeller Repeat